GRDFTTSPYRTESFDCGTPGVGLPADGSPPPEIDRVDIFTRQLCAAQVRRHADASNGGLERQITLHLSTAVEVLAVLEGEHFARDLRAWRGEGRHTACAVVGGAKRRTVAAERDHHVR